MVKGHGASILFGLHPDEPLDEVVGIGLRQAQRRQQAQRVLPSGAGEAVLVADEWLAHQLVRHVEFDANHQSATAHLLDVRAADAPDALHQVVAHLAGVLHQPFALHHVERGQCGGTGQMVAAEGGAQLAVFRLEVGADEHGAHGISHGIPYYFRLYVRDCLLY